MINITIVITSETCIEGKYNHLLLEKLEKLDLAFGSLQTVYLVGTWSIRKKPAENRASMRRHGHTENIS